MPKIENKRYDGFTLVKGVLDRNDGGHVPDVARLKFDNRLILDDFLSYRKEHYKEISLNLENLGQLEIVLIDTPHHTLKEALTNYKVPENLREEVAIPDEVPVPRVVLNRRLNGYVLVELDRDRDPPNALLAFDSAEIKDEFITFASEGLYEGKLTCIEETDPLKIRLISNFSLAGTWGSQEAFELKQSILKNVLKAFHFRLSKPEARADRLVEEPESGEPKQTDSHVTSTFAPASASESKSERGSKMGSVIGSLGSTGVVLNGFSLEYDFVDENENGKKQYSATLNFDDRSFLDDFVKYFSAWNRVKKIKDSDNEFKIISPCILKFTIEDVHHIEISDLLRSFIPITYSQTSYNKKTQIGKEEPYQFYLRLAAFLNGTGFFQHKDFINAINEMADTLCELKSKGKNLNEY